MVNKPDDPQRPHPDHPTPSDPHAEDALPGPPKGKTGSDSEVDLEAPGEEDLSGISVIEWAKLVENPDSKAGLGQKPVKPREEDVAEALAEVDAALPEPPKVSTGSDSEIDLSEHAPARAGDSARSGVEGESGLDLRDAARVAEKPAAPVPDDDSAIELGDADLVAGSSVVSESPAGPRPGTATPAQPLRGSVGSDSEIDLGDPTAPPPARKADSNVNFLAEDILLDPSSGVSSGKGDSGRDLVAEGLESGVGLGKKSQPPAEESDSLEHDFLKAPEATEESSSVDLGSVQSIPVFDIPEDLSRKDTERPPKVSPEFGASSSEIDLDPTAPPRGKVSPDSLSEVNLDEDSAPDIDLLAKKGPKTQRAPGGAVIEPAGEEEPAAKAPRRGLAGSALGGVACALAGGVLALGGAWAGGFLTGGTGPAPKQSAASMGGDPRPGPTVPPVMMGSDPLAQIRVGELDRVTDADLARLDEAKPDHLVARAQFHWMKYLVAERGKDPRAALKADAEPVKSALADLEKAMAGTDAAAAADALFLRAEIHELTGNEAAAKADYQAGAAKFAADPLQKLRFETALQVLGMESQRKVGSAAPVVPAHVLALLAVAFQAPAGGGAAQAPALPAEAGFAFWQAVQQAKAGKYAEAVKLLGDARARHDQRRYLLPKKQQNPLSDPRERIFLACCDELQTYWNLLARVSDPNYLAGDPKGRIPQLEALLTKAGEGAVASAMRDLSKQLRLETKEPSAGTVVKLIEAERAEKDKQLAARDAMLKEQKTEAASLGTKAKEVIAALTETRGMLQTARAELKQSQAEQAAAVAALKEVAKEVSSDFTDVKTSKETLLRDVRGTVARAKTSDPKGTLERLERELAADRARLAQRWEPAQMLPVWLPLLDQERGRADLASRADQDARRVLGDPAATAEQKGQALLIQGLVLRNEQKFREAVPVLEKARGALGGSRGEAPARCEAALKEAADPAAAVAARASRLEAQGKDEEARAVIARGLKDLPGGQGPLLVQRCKIAFEAARSKGPLNPVDPLVVAARADAAAAVKAGLPEGHYCLGRLDEELGRFDDAEASYRAALKGHGALDADGSRYRVALARALLRRHAGPAARAQRPLERRFASLGHVGLLMSLTLQGVPNALAAGEAGALADEVLEMGDKAPAGARAQALAIKGLHTKALQVAVAGLRDSRQLAPEPANNLLGLIGAQPAARQRAESLTRGDPARAERHYAAGVNDFFARNYPRAEKELQLAVENDSTDARYFYYLGLARLAQGKREAYEDFAQGSRLEQANRPYRAAVAAALERVQGRLRSVLNEVRSAPTLLEKD